MPRPPSPPNSPRALKKVDQQEEGMLGGHMHCFIQVHHGASYMPGGAKCIPKGTKYLWHRGPCLRCFRS